MKKITFFILFFSFFIAKAQVNTQDSLALLALYNSTDGANWSTTWDLNNPVSSWNGVSITSGRVVSLNLTSDNLVGFIPSELGNLTALTSLFLNVNQLTGSIPSELGNLTALTNLDLGNNQLTGSIPSELGNLTNLQILSLFNNRLTGSIPSELGNLTTLTNLALFNNRLTGSIPSELGNLTALTSLDLSSNELTSIPPELFNLTDLPNLNLNNNQFTGSIPSELSNLTALRFLNLNNNQFTGSIPTELSNLTALTRLDLNNNQLTGSIPTGLGNLTALTRLELDNNQLTGSIPTGLGNLTALTVLELDNNQLTGSIPTGLGNLTALTTLELDNNQFTDLPDLSHITGLNGSTNFSVQNNFLDFGDIEPNRANLVFASNYSPQGPVREGQTYPDVLGTNLVLSVVVNGTGNVYQWFFNDVAIGGANTSSLNLTNIQEADFGSYYCQISNPNVPGLTLRSLPDIVGNPFLSDILTSDFLILLNLYNSTNGAGWNTTWDLALSPTSWDGITLENQRVVSIVLANNNLLGALASDLGLLDSLQTLDLGTNELSGVLPAELGNLAILTRLELDSNQFTGSIPQELGNLAALTTLDLGTNELSGVLPTELGNLTALTTLELDNNQFTDLPDLSHITGLNGSTNFSVQNNFLDFGDIEPNQANLGSASNYSPQGPVREGQTYPNVLGTDLVLSVAVNGTGNAYQWFLNGVAIGGASASSLNLTNIQEADFGSYYCQISNPNVPGLTLRSSPDIVGNPFPSDILTSDFLILLNLYNNTSGAGWNTTWDLALSPTTWDGIILENQRVVSIVLANNNLLGALASDLGLLDSLQTLDLGTNELSGVLPAELGNLAILTTLDLSENQLTGSIPTELGNLTALTTLELNDNQLTDLPDLSHITGLDGDGGFQVQNNFLDFGDIEPNRANLFSASNYSPQGPVREGQTYPNVLGTDLVLSVTVNGTGNVYQWFFNGVAIAGASASSLNLTNIQEADFGSYYCQISNPNVPGLTLRSLPDVVGNPFSSDIVSSDFFILLNLYNSTDGAGWNTTWDLLLSPTNWGGITLENQRVVAIDLANNNLFGTLASDLGLLDSLQTLDLGTNELSGVLPEELSNLDILTRLELDSNQFTGSIPQELGNLTALTRLFLNENQLTGSIPSELGNLDSLTTLGLSKNQLTGSIPQELGNLAILTRLELDSNQFTGSIPQELGNLTALTRLFLNENQLTGSIPSELSNLAALSLLYLEDNQLRDLPDLSHITGLNGINNFRVGNNFLGFEDIEPNLASLNPVSSYSPQKPVREGENYTLPSGSNLMLSVDVDGTGNIYQWFYNSNPIANASNSSLDLVDLQAEESGLYYCEISNPNVPNLILTSSPDSLKVLPNTAPTGIALSNNSIEENLAIGTLIGLFSTTDANPTDKHTYTISDNTNFQISADSLYANISFDYETIESYNLTVTSTDLGGLTYSDDLIISIIDGDDGGLVTGIEDVFTQTEIVLYPNPSTNFLHIRGLKKIGVVELLFYNLQGQIVKEYSEIQDVYDVSDLPKGFYIALIKTLNFEKTINFIIN